MGNAESSTEATQYATAVAHARAQQPPHARSLAELGIVSTQDASFLKRPGWTTTAGMPVFVAHETLGMCQTVAHKSAGLAGEHSYYVVRVVNPLFVPGTSEPLSGDYFVVPEFERAPSENGERARLVHFLQQAIIEFRPFAGDGDKGAGAPDAGFITVLTHNAVSHRMSYAALRLAMTLRAGDEGLAKKLAFIDCDCLRDARDVAALQRAVLVLQQHCPQTAPYVSTRDSEAKAWGDALVQHTPAVVLAAPSALSAAPGTSIAAAMGSRKK